MQRLDVARDDPAPAAGPSRSRSVSHAPSEHSDARSADHGAPQAAPHEQVWYLKTIDFTSPAGESRQYNIVTQNYNGPCSFIAICNILILRGQIEILPRNRTSVSYEFLAQLVGEHILLTAPEIDVSAALSMMPLTLRGMDLNPVFTSPTAFRPATTGGELALFASAGIALVHGWLADPAAEEYAAVARARDYDAALNLIVAADVLTRGRLVGEGAGAGTGAGPSTPNLSLSDAERRTVEDAVAIQAFLDSTRSQLTYHGLFTLAALPSTPSTPTSTAPAPELFALFRNSHLAVLLRHAGALYTLVTDHVFVHEPSVVWERLEDVDQGGAVFVDAQFARAAPVGGDWAGWTPAPEDGAEAGGTVDPADHALAMQLQRAEDERAQAAYARREEERAARRGREEVRQAQHEADKKGREKKERKKRDSSCVLM
ncbi:hypothetical protein BC834DRAFT_830663 [Gloeopeniophorella convolvens]|nr:hypothetical protein BC834DRAFT_830663 [Gloeopeniophorella convolvens]